MIGAPQDDPTYDPERDRVMRERLEQATKELSERVRTSRQVRAEKSERRRAKEIAEGLPAAVRFEDFLYYSPENKFIFKPTGSLWPASAVNARLPWINKISPASIIARSHAVEQMTWLPGEPPLIKHKLIVQGGVIEHINATVFNLYRGPDFKRGDVEKARVWCEHIRYVYPEEADHIIKWLAYRCQHPDIKIEHALVLSGTFGIGKDTLLEPVVHALGSWNVQSVTPTQMLERFNGHLKSILLIINEARDLGDVNRPVFYERTKMIISSPHNLLIDEKNRQPYLIKNLVGVVYTSNHKVAGMYLAPDDRRHLVAWSPREIDDFKPSYVEYFNRVWASYDDGGFDGIATYLHTLDVSDFNPKAPPPKTNAFHEIVIASQHWEAGDLGGILEKVGRPTIVALDDLCDASTFDEDTIAWIKDRKNRRMMPRWFEQCDYLIVRNPGHKQGLWSYNGKQQMFYGRKDLPFKELNFLASLKVRGRG